MYDNSLLFVISLKLCAYVADVLIAPLNRPNRFSASKITSG